MGRGKVSYTYRLMSDVVEVLLEAHAAVRQMLVFAESLAGVSATEDGRRLAEQVADFVEWLMPLHRADEDESIHPRLAGKLGAVDESLRQMERQHFALEAPLARLRLVARAIATDVSRLHALRFEVEASASALRVLLEEHMALEESLVFPALKRLLYVDELESIEVEMRQRRVA